MKKHHFNLLLTHSYTSETCSIHLQSDNLSIILSYIIEIQVANMLLFPSYELSINTICNIIETLHEVSLKKVNLEENIYQNVTLPTINNAKKIGKGYYEVNIFWLYCYSDIFDSIVTQKSEIYLLGKAQCADMFKHMNNRVSLKTLREVNNAILSIYESVDDTKFISPSQLQVDIFADTCFRDI